MTEKKRDTLYRIAKAVVLYFVYLLTTLLTPLIMKSWADNENLRGFWTEDLFSAVDYVYSFLILFSLISIFVLHDGAYRLRFLAAEGGLNGPLKKIRFLLSSRELWLDILTLYVMIAAIPGFPYTELRFGFLRRIGTVWHFPIYLGVSYAAVLLFSLAAYYSTLNWWARPKEKRRERLKKKEAVDWVKQVLGSVALYLCGAYALPLVVPIVWSALLTFTMFAVGFTVMTVTVIAGIFSFKYFRALFYRLRLMKRLKRVLKSDYCRLVRMKNVYRSIFGAQDGENVLLRRNGRNYYCKIVTPLRRKDNVLFDEQGRVKVVKKMIVGDYSYENDYFFKTEEGAKRILIVDPATARIYATDGLHDRALQSGERVMGYYVYTSDNFINAIERGYL